MQLTAEFVKYAARRLKISRMERQRFKVSPQIPLEICLLIGAHGGSIALSTIYEEIPATEKAIRLHLHNLSSSGLISEHISVDDKRSKEIAFTQRGFDELSEYIANYRLFRQTEGTD